MREQEGCCLRQTPTPNLLGRYSVDQTGKHQASFSILPATLGINQYSPPEQTDPLVKKKKKKLENKQQTEN
jgi:hypothetical protein